VLASLAATVIAVVIVTDPVAGLSTRAISVSPQSGPPGSSVSIGGRGCNPGPAVSAGSDYVQLTSTMFGTLAVPVSANGSWSTNVVVGGLALPLPTPIDATCFTDGAPSTDTQYSVAIFTVGQGSSPTTTPSLTPTTLPTSPTTAPTSPTTAHGGGGGPDNGGGSGGGTNGGANTSRVTTGHDASPSNAARPGAAHAKDAADAGDVDPLSVGLDEAAGGHSTSHGGGIGSVWWALLLLALIAGGGAASWVVVARRGRRSLS
jgi:hypothetical protein